MVEYKKSGSRVVVNGVKNDDDTKSQKKLLRPSECRSKVLKNVVDFL